MGLAERKEVKLDFSKEALSVDVERPEQRPTLRESDGYM